MVIVFILWENGVPEKKWQATTGRKISSGHPKEIGPYPVYSLKSCSQCQTTLK